MQPETIPKEDLYSEQADIETSSEDYAKRFSGIIGEYFLDVQEKIILQILNDKNYETILDVGGGHAQIAVPLIKNGYDVTIIGSNQKCSSRLEKFLKPDNFKYHSGNLLKLPYNDKSFDAVTCFRLLTHEKNWKAQISELCRVAKYEVIIDYPDSRSFNILYNHLFYFKKRFERNTRTYRNFSRNEIIREFRKNGFGKHELFPEFFLPMVVHRFINNVFFSKITEKLFNKLYLTELLGSPVIFSAGRQRK